MSDDRIDFISAYCDRWCDRCAFTDRCSAYAIKAAIAMCDGDYAAAVELAVGAPRDANGDASRRTGLADERLADYEPTEKELDEVRREMEERDERIDESPLTTDSRIVSMLAHRCLDDLRERLEAHDDRNVREAFEITSWDCLLIHVKLHRALSSHDESQAGWMTEDDPIQNDGNGSAKVALLSIDRSIPAWDTIAVAMADADAAAIAERLRALRVDVERQFPTHEGSYGRDSMRPDSGRLETGGPAPCHGLRMAAPTAAHHLSLLCLQTFDVPEVLRSSPRTLVADERLAAEEVDHDLAELPRLARWPGLIESEPGQFGQQVDAGRRNADLKDDSRAPEILFRDVVQRRTERGECTHDEGRICRRRVDPDVEVAGRTRTTVMRQGIRTDDQEPDLSVA
jgi:hypothetical protein